MQMDTRMGLRGKVSKTMMCFSESWMLVDPGSQAAAISDGPAALHGIDDSL